jgi:hypothetical protein
MIDAVVVTTSKTVPSFGWGREGLSSHIEAALNVGNIK